MSYTIDVFRGELINDTFFTMYPQLLAGNIDRQVDIAKAIN